MPYINQKNRKYWDPLVDRITPAYNLEAGDMNYIITRLIHNWIKDHGLCYTNLNEAMGILECAKQEFYRTVVAPYEDKKRRQNGPISELDKERSDE